MNDFILVIIGAICLFFTFVFFCMCYAVRDDAKLIKEMRKYTLGHRIVSSVGLVCFAALDILVAIQLMKIL